MILGLGLDLVEVERVRRMLERHGDRFRKRLLHELEIPAYQALKGGPGAAAAFLAKRWAAKEALAKALGRGFGAVVDPRHIILYQDSGGAPGLRCVQSTASLLDKSGVRRIHLSISDERRYAVVCVVLEGVPEDGCC